MSEPPWVAWRSSPTDASVRLESTTPAATDLATRTLDLVPGTSAQTWRGVGAALTDASTMLLGTSDEATELLFDPDRADGAHLNLVRLPLSATDFSTRGWTFGWDDPSGTLTASPEAEASADFVAEDLRALRPDLEVVAAPWSAPAPMKSTGALNGGALKDASVAAYGRLLEAQAAWLLEREVPLTAMSLGNEPFHASSTYPTMLQTVAQMADLAKQVGPALASRSVELWSVDHNWEHRSYYDQVHAAAPGRFAASAFHCYGGSPNDMAGVTAPPVVTECTGTDDGFVGTFRWDAQNLVVRAIDAGSTGLMMWNLALNQHHGPHTGGCGTCRGVLEVHDQTGQVVQEPEFYTLAHLSRAADPGAVVIGSSPAADVPYVAFRNPDDSLGVIGHNDTGEPQVLAVAVDGQETGARLAVGPGELFTVRGGTRVEVGSVLVDSEPRVGREMQASATGWGPAPLSFAYQWFADGQPVAGADDARFVPTPAELGSTLTVRVTGSRPGYVPATTTSLPVGGAVRRGRIELAQRGRVVGRLRVGSVLEARGWAASVQALPSYRWQRDGVALAGGRSAQHRITRSDRGARLSVRVTLRAAGYAARSWVLDRDRKVR